MDVESARKANLLVGNDEKAPVVELLFTGARLRAVSAAELAMAGAEVACEWPHWRNFSVAAGDEISFGSTARGRLELSGSSRWICGAQMVWERQRQSEGRFR